MTEEVTPDEIARMAERIEAKAYWDVLENLRGSNLLPIKVDALNLLEGKGGIPAQLRGRYFDYLEEGIAALSFVAEEDMFRSIDTHRVLYLGMDEPATEDWVAAIFRLYEHYHAPFRIQLTPYSQPSNLGQWIVDRHPGVKASPGTDKFLWEAEGAPFQWNREDFGIVKIDEGAASAYAGIVADSLLKTHEAWQRRRWTDCLEDTVNQRSEWGWGWHHYVAIDGRRPEAFAAAATYIWRDVAYLFISAIAGAERYEGVQQALIQTRVEDALQVEGVRWIVADTRGGTSRSDLERAGFRHIYSRTDYGVA
ncbi:MAG: hypothetical protein M3437_00770 [Chloroflexota bacterium]|nr:hypothetical protein [Chloroflexota bacterium]MDQ5866305.1 hypothetical protein [Chloroflexota bacterium]